MSFTDKEDIRYKKVSKAKNNEIKPKEIGFEGYTENH